MHLKGHLISLRAVEPSDLELLYLWENNPLVWHLSNTTAPFSKHILKEYIENAKHDIYVTKQLRLIINTPK
jgi:diamine N-acetyltransferase